MNTVVLTKYNHYLRILCSQFSVCQIILGMECHEHCCYWCAVFDFKKEEYLLSGGFKVFSFS